MPPPDTKTAPLGDTYNEERLKAWKEKRARVAEQSREERARQAEAEKRARQAQLEEEKAKRAQEAAEERARVLAAEKAERMAVARAKLAARSDIDSARSRLMAYRGRAARLLVLRLAAFIGLPTALVAIYLFAIATPLYLAETRLIAPNPTPNTSMAPVFGGHGSQDVFQARAIIMSPQMFQSLDAQHGFIAHYSDPEVDPLTRMRAIPALQISDFDQYARFVAVDIDAYEGLITLRVKARDPETARAFSDAILFESQKRLATLRSEPGFVADSGLRMLHAPAVESVAAFPRKLPGTLAALLAFTALYALGSIFLGTIVRHSTR